MTVRFDVIAGVGIGAAILGVLAWVTRPVKPASVTGKSKSEALRELFRKHPEAFIIAHHGDSAWQTGISTVLGDAPSAVETGVDMSPHAASQMYDLWKSLAGDPSVCETRTVTKWELAPSDSIKLEDASDVMCETLVEFTPLVREITV